MVINIKTKDEVKKYLPKHPMDNYHINELMELTDEEFQFIIDDLLVWMKNMQHAVSSEVALVLTKRHNVLKDILVKNLDDNKVDAVWKYNIIRYVISSFSKEDKEHYKKAIKRIANKPTEAEKYAEVDRLSENFIIKPTNN